MREKDIEALDVNYPTGDRLNHTSFSRYLGLDIGFIERFHDKIVSTFSESVYGIGWMDEYENLDFRRRILISDQILQSLRGIELNLIEAKIHVSKLNNAWDKEAERLKYMVTIVDSKPFLRYPERNKPLDDLDSYIANMNLKGVFVSICSAIDCLSAVVVGIMGLETDIFKIGYPSLRAHLENGKDFNYAKGVQRTLLKTLNEFEAESGPDGWRKWVFDYRNMTIHRGRQMHFGTALYDGKEGGRIKTKAVNLLTSNPAVSEIESMKDQIIQPLSEDGRVTIDCSLQSCLKFCELVIAYQEEIWELRISNIDEIVQPKTQWKTIRNGHRDQFVGFKAGTVSNVFDMLTTNPEFIRRMKTSALDGENIYKWKEINTGTGRAQRPARHRE